MLSKASSPPEYGSKAKLLRDLLICRTCPRLVEFREGVLPRASFSRQRYWRRPVPGFGDIDGKLLIIGIAPAAHGGNRTGRVFTGDSSGRFLVKALYSSGFASQPISESKADGLAYIDCYVTAAVKCAPPGDRPTTSEFENCSVYLDSEIALMKNLRAVLTLGALAFRAYVKSLSRGGFEVRGVKFIHGRSYEFKDSPTLWSSYHPSPRNTNTGKLTQPMLVDVLRRIRGDVDGDSRKHN